MDSNGRNTAELRGICDRLMDPYIPMQSGQLKINKSYPKANQIKYNVPYAHYHFIGKKAIGPSRPKGIRRKISNQDMHYRGLRGPHWDKRMYEARKNDIARSIEMIMKGN